MNGLLYGATNSGGSEHAGVAFVVDPTTGSESVLHTFGKNTDGSQPTGGFTTVGDKFYGTTSVGGVNGAGTIFSIVPSSGVETVVYAFPNDGYPVYPNGGLVAMGSVLYGTTVYGGDLSCGSTGCGTIFSFGLRTKAETVLHSFGSNQSDGDFPYAPLTTVHGTLYGTTVKGGATPRPGYSNDDGVVFAFTP